LPISIQHIIGTVSILMLTISISLAFSTVSSYVQTDISKKEMAQVADHVSLNLMEVATLTNSSTLDTTIVKTIDLPAEVGGRAYFVELINATNEGKGYVVQVGLVSQLSVNVNSSLPISTLPTKTVNVTTVRISSWEPTWNITVFKSQPLVKYLNTDTKGFEKAIVYGGTSSVGLIPVVWACQDQGVLYMGIGTYQK
jgi:hypothetical protein